MKNIYQGALKIQEERIKLMGQIIKESDDGWTIQKVTEILRGVCTSKRRIERRMEKICVSH